MNNHSLPFPHQTSLLMEITFWGSISRATYDISFSENHLILTDAKHKSKPSIIEFTSIASVSQEGDKISLTLKKPIGPIKKIILFVNNDTTQKYINYVASKVEEQNASNPIQTTSKHSDSKNRSESFIVKLWNNNSVLICITIALLVLFGIIFSNSMMLYTISMIICLGGGVFVSWMIGTDKGSGLAHLGRSLLIAFLVGIIIVFMGSFGSSSNSNKDGDVCGICGGDGVVTSKILGEGSGIQYGFDTYYRCAGCHGTGRD